MSDDSQQRSARAGTARSASARPEADRAAAPEYRLEHSSELDVDSLLRDVHDTQDGEPESGALDTIARASQALSLPPSAPEAPVPDFDDLETGLDLGSDPFAARSSATGLSRPSTGPRLLHALGTPATPMAVPALRPPSAAPPPVRGSSAPVPHLGAPLAPRVLIPPLAPPPGRTREAGLAAVAQTAYEAEAEAAATRSARTTAPVFRSRNALPEAAPAPNLLVPGPVAPSAPEQAPSEGPSRRWWWLAVPLFILLLTLVVLAVQPKPAGTLVISVATPSTEAVPRLRVYVDDQLRCSYSPCRVEGLSLGHHDVRAEAPDFVVSERHPVSLSAGTDASYSIILLPVLKHGSATLSAKGEELTLFVDDQALGASPVELKQLSPGVHRVRVQGPRFETLEESFELRAEQHLVLGPFKPKVKRGLLRLRAGAGAEGALVTLNGQNVQLPAEVELAGQTEHQLVAERPDFDRFQTVISFPDGKAVLDVDVVLLEADVESDTALAQSSAASKSVRAGSAVLNMNSIPASDVVLDGKVLGRTPRVGIKTSPGQHSVVFIHPERGKKSVKLRVGAGQSKNVSVRF